jgi:hypothetical protein
VDYRDANVEILGVRLDGSVTPYAVVPNAYAGSLHICRTLAQEYRRPLDAWGIYRAKELGDLFGTDILAPNDAIVLGFTAGSVWVRRENIERLIGALRAFWEEHSSFSSLLGETIALPPTIPGVIDALQAARDEPELRGVCFNQTSVVATVWHPVGWTPEPRPFNFDLDDLTLEGVRPWELFEALEAAGAFGSIPPGGAARSAEGE